MELMNEMTTREKKLKYAKRKSKNGSLINFALKGIALASTLSNSYKMISGQYFNAEF